jgi:nicotinamide-nucleotide amidase
MHAEIIAIGDEITSGQALDTNTRWLSQRLEESGIRVLYHVTVGDDLEAMAEVFRLAILRADVVMSTGGLGPTADDLTREAIAKATARPLALDREALAGIKALFARRKRDMPKRNEVQAMFPAGSRVIPNPNGTAPGIALDVPRERQAPCRVFALPGVPPEMKEMWHQTVSTAIARSRGEGRMILRRDIKCFGAGESTIESMLPDLIRRDRVPRVGINASKATIILRIAADGASVEQCEAAIEPTRATIYRKLGNLVFGEGDEELPHAVVRLLRRQKRTLATFEWGTAGRVADWMGEVAEAREHYLGGIVVSDEGGLVGAGGVPAEIIAQHSSTSPAVARAMADGCRRRFGSDYGLAVTRFPEYDADAREPSPFFLGLAGPDGCQVKAIPYAGHPSWLRVYCAKHALNLVRLAMLEQAQT